MKNTDLSDMIIRKVCAINKINMTTTQTNYRENREMWALSIKTNGKTVYESEGKEFTSDINHIILLPKGCSYAFTCQEFGECLMIEFEADVTAPVHGIRCFKTKNTIDLMNIFNRLEHLWTFKKSTYKMKCMGGLYEILSILVEAEFSAYHPSDKYDLIKPAIKYLEENYIDKNLNNRRLSEISGISTVYFRKLFTSIYHVSPMKYIRSVRIEKAKDFLISDYSSITNIAESVGFSSIFHFSKTFKKVTGYTPSEFSRHYSNTDMENNTRTIPDR